MEIQNNTKLFNQILANNFVANLNNAFLIAALSFWIYLETNSIVATSIMAGSFALLTISTGVFWGILVDKYPKKTMMIYSSIGTLVCYILATLVYYLFLSSRAIDIQSAQVWLVIGLIIIGAIFGNIRNIVLPTTVSMLFVDKDRPKANGLVGIATGLAFIFSSIISGLIIGFFGLVIVLWIGMIFTGLVIIHALTIQLSQPKVELEEQHAHFSLVGVSKTIELIQQTPGLMAMIFFSTFNNFVGGVYGSLFDPYGLSLVSVQTWGTIWGCLGFAFVIGGMIITKYGLGKNPVKTFFLCNIITWIAAGSVGLQQSIWLMIFCSIFYMTTAPIIEACEQTILQKIIPLDRQGSVFGFANSIRSVATPVTAFFIGPFTQIVMVPFMTTGLGAQYIGSWFGTGQPRAIGLVFMLAGVIGLIFTIFAIRSRSAKILSKVFALN